MAELQEFELGGRTFRVWVDEQHQWFWKQMRDGIFEPETFALYKHVITAETLYIDIGSWLGPTVLYAGSLAKRVIAIEPIAVSMAAMLRNVEANEDILQKTEFFNLAIAPESKVIKLYNGAFGDGMASILPHRGHLSMTFMALGIDELLDRVLGDEPHVFIKVDIEGGEFALVPKLCASLRHRGVKADLYVSLHGSFAENSSHRVEMFADNLAQHGVLLRALAEYGDVCFPDGSTELNFAPIEGNPGANPNFTQLLTSGGIDTTIFVKAR